MKYDRDIHNRRSIRLPGYDYAQEGAYFITLCTHNRECIFGEIANQTMQLNQLGKIIVREWTKTPQIRPNVSLDEFILMPNHFHAIALIKVRANNVRAYCDTPQPPQPNKPPRLKSPSQTIGAIVRGFKGATTKIINQMCETPGKLLWQRNYYESIIRDEEHLNNVRQYIINNPAKWESDRDNPQNHK